MPAFARATAALLAALAGCGGAAEEPLPRLARTEGVDPFVLERIQGAIAACERGEPHARLELAKVYDANGLGELALAAYDQCLAHAAGAPPSEQAALHYLRAAALETLGRATQALAGFDAALALVEDDAPSHWHRAELLLDDGRGAEARAAFTRALELEPGSVPARLGLARAQLLEDDARGAIATLEPVLARSSDERFVHGLLARAYRALGDSARAEVELRREERSATVSMSDPRLAEVRTRATGVLHGVESANEALARGDAPGAVALLEPLLARVPQDLAVQQMLGKALISAGEHERAVQLLEAAVAQHPDQFKLELFLGQAYDGKRAEKKALEHLRRARELNPAFGPTLAALGEVEMKLRQFDAAEETLSAALEAGGGELRTRILLGQVQIERAALERAQATFEAARTAYPNAVSAWTYLAEVQARRGERDAARVSLAEAEKRNPDYERLPLVRKLLDEGGASGR